MWSLQVYVFTMTKWMLIRDGAPACYTRCAGLAWRNVGIYFILVPVYWLVKEFSVVQSQAEKNTWTWIVCTFDMIWYACLPYDAEYFTEIPLKLSQSSSEALIVFCVSAGVVAVCIAVTSTQPPPQPHPPTTWLSNSTRSTWTSTCPVANGPRRATRPGRPSIRPLSRQASDCAPTSPAGVQNQKLPSVPSVALPGSESMPVSSSVPCPISTLFCLHDHVIDWHSPSLQMSLKASWAQRAWKSSVRTSEWNLKTWVWFVMSNWSFAQCLTLFQVVMLCLAYKLEAQQMGFFTKAEWLKGMTELQWVWIPERHLTYKQPSYPLLSSSSLTDVIVL